MSTTRSPIPNHEAGPICPRSFNLPFYCAVLLDAMEEAFHKQFKHPDGGRFSDVSAFIIMVALEKLSKDPTELLKHIWLNKPNLAGIVHLVPPANPKEG